MNNRSYRLVYSKLRGMLVAVEETATGEGKANRGEFVRMGRAPPGGAGGAQRISWVRFRLIAWAAMVVAGVAPIVVNAQVVADPNAGAHRPTVISTASGIEQVYITAP